MNSVKWFNVHYINADILCNRTYSKCTVLWIMLHDTLFSLLRIHTVSCNIYSKCPVLWTLDMAYFIITCTIVCYDTAWLEKVICECEGHIFKYTYTLLFKHLFTIVYFFYLKEKIFYLLCSLFCLNCIILSDCWNITL